MSDDFDKRNLLGDDIRKLSEKAQPAKKAKAAAKKAAKKAAAKKAAAKKSAAKKSAAKKSAADAEKARQLSLYQEKLDDEYAEKIFKRNIKEMTTEIKKEAIKGEWKAKFQISAKSPHSIRQIASRMLDHRRPWINWNSEVVKKSTNLFSDFFITQGFKINKLVFERRHDNYGYDFYWDVDVEWGEKSLFGDDFDKSDFNKED